MESNTTFFLAAFNEGFRIEYTVRNLIKYGRVVILDGGSTDNTREVAEKWGAEFVIRPKTDKVYPDTEEVFNFAKNMCKTEWMYYGWVDNLFPKALLEKMRELAGQSQYKYIYIPIDTYMWGDMHHKVLSAAYPCFFMKEYVDFKDNLIHGLGNFNGKNEEVFHLPKKPEYSIVHFSLYDQHKFVLSHLRYAEAEAEEKFQAGKKPGVVYLLGSPARYFFLFYKYGFKAGVRGLYTSLLYAFFRLMVAVRLYELQSGETIESMEAEFAKTKKRMVEEVES